MSAHPDGHDNGGAHIRCIPPQKDCRNHERERTIESALAGTPPTAPKRQYISFCPRSWVQRYNKKMYLNFFLCFFWDSHATRFNITQKSRGIRCLGELLLPSSLLYEQTHTMVGDIVNVLNIPVDFFHLAGEPERRNGLLAVF